MKKLREDLARKILDEQYPDLKTRYRIEGDTIYLTPAACVRLMKDSKYMPLMPDQRKEGELGVFYGFKIKLLPESEWTAEEIWNPSKR